MWKLLAGLAVIGLAIYDARFTTKRRKDYVFEVEMNPAARKHVWAAILVPTLVLTILAGLIPSELPMGILLGIRVCLFDFQMRSREAANVLKEAFGGRTPSTAPVRSLKDYPYQY